MKKSAFFTAITHRVQSGDTSISKSRASLQHIALAILTTILASGAVMGQVQWPAMDKNNIAQFKPASQINVFEAAHANRAVDGNIDGNWWNRSVTHTHDVQNPWWEVNLLEAYDISAITIYNRTDAVQDRLNNFTILVSEEPFEGNFGGLQFLANGANFTGSKRFAGNARGQYIRIYLNQPGILSLAEVVVNGTPVNAPKLIDRNDNLALGKRTRQSSLFDLFGANKANDGDTNGNWNEGSVSHTQSDAKAWWEIDLGKNYLIEEVVVHNRTDGWQERLNNFNIWVTPKPKDQMGGRRVTPFAKDEKNFAPATSKAFTGKQVGRYICIELNGKEFLSLTEVQIFGSEIGDLTPGQAQTTEMYKVSIFRNMSSTESAIKSSITQSVSEGMDFNRTVNREDKTHWNLSTTAKATVNLAVVALEFEVTAGVGGEVTNGTQTSQGNNINKTFIDNTEISQTVPGGSTRYEFHKFVLNQTPLTYKFNGETYSWFLINEKAMPAGDITVMVFENDMIPELTATIDGWVLPVHYREVIEAFPQCIVEEE